MQNNGQSEGRQPVRLGEDALRVELEADLVSGPPRSPQASGTGSGASPASQGTGSEPVHERLRESEERFRSYFELGLIGMAMTSPTKNWIQVNDKLCEILGYDRHELMQKTWAELTHPDDLAADVAQFNRVFAGEMDGYAMDKRFLRKNGQVIFTTLSVKCLRRADRTIDYFVVLVQDITARKEAEAALARERDLLQSVLNSAGKAHLVYLDRDFNFVRVNETYAATCGCRPAEMIGKNHFALYPNAENEAIFRRVRDTGQPFEVHAKPFEFPDQPERGVTYWDWTLVPVKDAAGQVTGLIFSLFETTARVRAEAAARESEERTRRIAQAARVGFFEWNAARDTAYWSVEHYELFGYEPGSAMSWQRWRQDVHPEDRERVMASAARLLERGRADGRVRGHKDEYRFIRPDGTVVWLGSDVSLDMVGGEPVIRGLVRDITDRKQAEEALRRALAKAEAGDRMLAALMANVPEGITICDAEGNIRMVSQHGQDLLGGPHADNSIEEVARNWTVYRPDHSTAMPVEELPLARALKGETVQDVELVQVSANGRKLPLLCNAAPIRDCDGHITAAVVAWRDITERKRAEEALRDSQAKFSTFFHRSPNFALLTRAETGEIVEVNDGYCRLTGYTREELIGHTTIELGIIPPDARAHLLASLEESGRVECLETVIRTKTGQLRTVIASTDRFLSGSLVMLGCTGADITDRKRAEEALRQAADELARSNKDLEQFAYVASHDLQEPLRTIRAFLDILVKRSSARLDDKERQYIGFVVDGAARMQALIADLLAYSRAGSKGLEIADIPLGEGVQGALAALARSIQEANATVCVGDLPAVKADPGWITQVFQNLIANAVKFSRPGMRPQVSISAARDKTMCTVCVRDNGIGIPADQCNDRLFEPFKRLHTRQQYAGTGIGLATCKKIVERHGGRIWVESRPDEGSSFFFTVPLAGPESSVETGWRAQAGNVAGSAGLDMRRALEEESEARKQAEMSEERLLALMDHNPSLVFLKDDRGRYVYMNAAYVRLFAAGADWRGKTDYDFWTKESADVFRANDAEVLQSGVARQFLEDSKDAEGKRYCWLCYKFPFTDSQGQRYMGGIGIDVTQRVLAEETLRSLQSRTESILASITDAFFAIDLEWRFTYVNAEAERVLRRPASEMLGQNVWTLFLNAEAFRRRYEQALANQQAEHFEEYYEPLATWVEVHAYPSADGLSVYFRDVTERRRTAEALRESEERLQSTLQASGVGTFELDLSTGVGTWNAVEYELLGLKPGDAPPNPETFFRYVHPQDAAELKEAWDQATRTGKLEAEFRVIRADGQERWLAGKGEFMRAEPAEAGGPAGTGHPLRFLGVNFDITDRKRAEAAVQQERDRLSALVESIADEIWVADADKKITLVNPAGRKEFGWDLADVNEVEKMAASLEVYRPDGTPRPVEEAPPLRALRGETVMGQEEIVRTPATGQLRHRQVNAAPVRDRDGNIIGSVSVVRDITDRKRAEEEVRHRDRLYRAIGESINYGVWICDRDGRNIYASESFLKLVGLTQQQCSEFGWGDVLHPEDAERTLAAWKECVRTEGTWDIEHRFRGVDGQWHPILARGVPVRDEKGGILCWAGINLDIGRLKSIEQSLRRVISELERSNRELEQFAYISAHDLQEPLRQVRIYANLLKERHADRLDGKALQYLGFLHEGATRMSDLVAGLLAYGRVRTPNLNGQAVSVDAALDKALARLTGHVQDSRAEITRDSLPAVAADEEHLGQLFENLISNAVKFREERVQPHIHIGCRDDGDEWIFSVRDNGIGIEPPYREKVFQIFQRLHTRQKYPGAGIGLSICKKIVEQHGGRIWIEPTVGGGTTFCFSWPKERAV